MDLYEIKTRNAEPGNMPPSCFSLVLLHAAALAGYTAAQDEFALPEDILIGAGVSAFQTEGAWNLEGKAESAVDHLLNSSRLAALGFGDGAGEHGTAANSYVRFREDVKMAADLKLQLYRFSISWARLLPTGDASNVNDHGVTFYNNLIDEILVHNMTPMATLHHFDHPQILEDQFGAWQDIKMVDKFKEYARFAFNKFGDRVCISETSNLRSRN